MKRKTWRRMRKAFLEGLVMAAVVMILVGGASLDADPVKGLIIIAVSLILGGAVLIQNPGNSFMR